MSAPALETRIVVGSSPLALRVLSFEATTAESALTDPPSMASEAEPIATTAEQPDVTDVAILVEAIYFIEEAAHALASTDRPAYGKEPSPTSSSGLSTFDDTEQPGDESAAAAAAEPASEE